jgi:D-beta-D-heptose 7-phosphate kinase/D-beta-D-heptose 1-phosphate adenosyltransferase
MRLKGDIPVMRDYKSKILILAQMVKARKALREKRLKLVFTNGCFDLIHAGHTDYLAFARKQGDALVVGMNSDKSVRKHKGSSRPIMPQNDRAAVLASLEAVDYVVIFDEDEPAAIIEKILPDVLVKGEDWKHYVSGRETVEKHGGKVVLAPLVAGRSTSSIIKKIRDAS